MARVLVTGASGFVGRPAVAALRAAGHEVHAVGRAPAPGVAADVWHAADLLDRAALAPLVGAARATHLLHLAWTTEHGRFWDDPANHAWSQATIALVETFAAAGGRRAVLAGSCAQYAWPRGDDAPPLHESTSARDPATLYGQAKQATDEQLQGWAPAAGVSLASGLLFFPYGPGDQAGRLVPSVARALLEGREAPVSAGTQVRDFVHVDDCGAALAALVATDVTGQVNVGTGVGTPVAEVARTVARLVGREDRLRLGALAATDDAGPVVADVGRLRDEVGFTPRLDLETGLAQTVDWWRARMGAGQDTRRR